jgi:NitT/TauT family transport system substrate-binding protein
MGKMRLVKFLFLSLQCLSIPLTGYVHAQKRPVAYGALGGGQLPLFVTEAAGLSKKHGLDVELVFIEGGSRAVTALISGQTPIIGGDPSAIALAVGRGNDALIIASMTNTLPYFMVARPEIKTKEDLKGKRAAISRFGSASDFVTRLAVEGLGLVPDKDVAIVQVGAVPTRFAALESGTIHATVLTPPANLLAKTKGFTILVNVTALGLKIPNSAIGTTQSCLNSDRDSVRRFLRAYVEGIKVMKSDPTFSMKTLGKYSRVAETESLREAYEVYSAANPARPFVDPPSIQRVIDFLSKQQPEMAKLNPEEFMDMSLLQDIDRSGFIDELYRK